MTLKKLALTCAAAMLLAGTAAWADGIDFDCTKKTCTGTVTQSGSNDNTTGIHIYDDSGPYISPVATFYPIFNTATRTISVDGTGHYSGQDLVVDILRVDVLRVVTPEPASLVLFGSGLLAIGGVLRRKLRLK
jgi:PEP-CTERM motif